MLKAVMLITAIFVVLLAAGIVKAMALSILIPAVFSAIGYFTGSFIDKRLKAANKVFGGFGVAESSWDPFLIVVALEFGLICWTSIAASGINPLSQTNVWMYIELGILLLVFIAFCSRPSWWSILLLLLYHVTAIAFISHGMDQLGDFTQEVREKVERSSVVTILFHACAALSVGYYFASRIQLSDPNVAVWKNWASKGKSSNDLSMSDRLAQLSELHRKGLITDADLEEKKRNILKNL